MGTWIVVVSAALAVVTGFVLRTRMPVPVVAAVLAVAGAGIGWGGSLLLDDPSTGEFVLTVATMAVLIPAHARIVVGRFGPAGRGRGIRAMADPTGPPR